MIPRFIRSISWLYASILSSTYLIDRLDVVRAHAGEIAPSSIPDYSTINRRVNQLDIKINERIEK